MRCGWTMTVDWFAKDLSLHNCTKALISWTALAVRSQLYKINNKWSGIGDNISITWPPEPVKSRMCSSTASAELSFNSGLFIIFALCVASRLPARLVYIVICESVISSYAPRQRGSIAAAATERSESVTEVNVDLSKNFRKVYGNVLSSRCWFIRSVTTPCLSEVQKSTKHI